MAQRSHARLGFVVLQAALLATSMLVAQVDAQSLIGSSPMREHRADLTVTRLGDGRVLVTGGSMPSGPDTASTELFDPATGTFLPGAPMGAARSEHVATPLCDGRVLITGAYSDYSGAEVYDPGLGVFRPVGSLSVHRLHHQAVVLQDCRVLLVGGSSVSAGGPAATAEIFDPATDTFTATGDMATPRSAPTATLLPDGRVLVAGGYAYTSGNMTGLRSTEIYDPVTEEFTPGPDMTWARMLHTATTLPESGDVLVVGGGSLEPEGWQGRDTAEIFSLSSGSFTEVGRLAEGRHYHSATLLPDGSVLIAGGRRPDYRAVHSIEIFSPTTMEFTSAGSMASSRFAHATAVLPSGAAIIIGGYGDNGSGAEHWLSTAELYLPNPLAFEFHQNTFTYPIELATASSPLALMHAGAPSSPASVTILHEGPPPPAGFRAGTPSLYFSIDFGVASSGDAYGCVSFAAVAFSAAPALFEWTGSDWVQHLTDVDRNSACARVTTPTLVALFEPTPSGPLLAARATPRTATLPDGRLLITGGANYFQGNEGLATAEIFDGVTSTPAGRMATGRSEHAITSLCDGRVLVAGGGTHPWTAEVYDPATNTFSSVGPMTVDRVQLTATLLHDCRVLIAGGQSRIDGEPTRSAELFDPSTGTFAATGSMRTRRTLHAATILADGRVLIVGGYSSNIGRPGVAEAEIFDPLTGQFEDAGAMHQSRVLPTATLLRSGEVLVAGGSANDLTGALALASAELFNPGSLSFSSTGSMAEARFYHTATPLSDGRVAITGGFAGPYLTGVELFSPDTGTFARSEPLAGARRDHFAALMMDGSLAVGLGVDGTFLSSVERLLIANTTAGASVAVSLTDFVSNSAPVTVAFDSVTAPGYTSLEVSTTGPAPPSGFQIGSPSRYYHVRTTASFAGLARVCVSYAGLTLPPGPASLLHFDGTAWVNVTTDVDTATQTICGSVASLSPFVVGIWSQRPRALDKQVTLTVRTRHWDDDDDRHQHARYERRQRDGHDWRAGHADSDDAIDLEWEDDVDRGLAARITLAGDDGDSPGLTFEVVTPPAHGSLSRIRKVRCQATGGGASCTARVVLTMEPHYLGVDTFTYRVGDGLQYSETATVTVNVVSPFATLTQSGWAAALDGRTPNLLDPSSFSVAYPVGGLRIGTDARALAFSSARAVSAFLPAGGKVGHLSAGPPVVVDPRSSKAGAFAGNLLALRLNVDYSARAVTRIGLGQLRLSRGPLAGLTIVEVLDLGNRALVGPSALPPGLSLGELNALIAAINSNFNRGVDDDGLLVP